MINNHGTFVQALLATGMISAPQQVNPDTAQQALELATVVGYGYQDSDEPGNTDQGNYFAVVYYGVPSAGLVAGEHAMVPYGVYFDMGGPQGSLGKVTVQDLVHFGGPLPTLDQLCAYGQWPLNPVA